MPWLKLARAAVLLAVSGVSAQTTPASTQSPDGSLLGSTAPQTSSLPAAPPRASKHQFFGGTVTQLDARHITVSRTQTGKSPEHRSFVITGETKISRAVKLRSRVTVRYRHLPDGDVALEIRLHPLTRAPRAS